MKKLMPLFLLFICVACFARDFIQVGQSYANFNTNPHVAYSVPDNKTYYVGGVMVSAYNSGAVLAVLQIKDSASVIHTIYLAPKIGSATVALESSQWLPALRLADTLTLNLSEGDSGSVGASITTTGEID